MAINLSRNTRVYFSANVDANGLLNDALSGYTSANTFEIAVQDGYSFSQGTQQQTITISEGGNTPVRGQRAFNTQLDPVDWSFSTYVRPELNASIVSPQERVLWNALLGSGSLDTAGTTVTGITRSVTTGAGASTATITCAALPAAPVVGDIINITGSTSSPTWNQTGVITTAHDGTKYIVQLAKAPSTAAGTASTGALKAHSGQWAPSGTAAGSFSYASTMGSNKNQFIKFGIVFCVDSVVYLVDNCAMDSVSVDFGLDAIATAAWTGKGTALRQATTLTQAHLGSNSTGISSAANLRYITNKLSTMTLQSNIGGTDNTATASTQYTIAITGGNITIANNINYLVPANLGVVNTAIGYFTGQRAISGNVTAYLKTGESYNSSGTLLSNLLTSASTTTEPKFRVQLEMGGASNANKVEFEMPGAVLQIPTVDVADVVSTTINFTAQGYNPDTVGASPNVFDLTKANDLQVRYFSN